MGGIVGILLAAGSGSRFGGDKLLHPLTDGTPMGVAAARSLRAALDWVIAVTRPGDDKLADLLAEAGCEVIVAPDAVNGMGHSLAAGVRAAPGADGWLIALGDMPFIKPATHSRVAQALRAGHSIGTPVYHGSRGHPVGFGAMWFAHLAGLEGDRGAKALFGMSPNGVYHVVVDDPGVVKDIDLAAGTATAVDLRTKGEVRRRRAFLNS